MNGNEFALRGSVARGEVAVEAILITVGLEPIYFVSVRFTLSTLPLRLRSSLGFPKAIGVAVRLSA
jgi:hypothetical protein